MSDFFKLKGEFYEALGKLSSELKLVEKSKSGYANRYVFAPIENCQAEYLPALKKHGFGMTQKFRYTDEGVTLLVTELGYKNGYSEISELPISPQDPHDPQKVGSWITYMKRYSANAILNLRTSDEDDDGEKTVNRNQSTKPQAEKSATPTPKNKLCSVKQAGMVRGQLKKFFNGNEPQSEAYLLKKFPYTMGSDGRVSAKLLSYLDASALIDWLKKQETAGKTIDDFEGQKQQAPTSGFAETYKDPF